MLNQPTHIKDIDGYVFFSNQTTGMSGKPVKIHSRLFLDFYCSVDPSTHDGQAVIRDIENLKVTAKANTIPNLPTAINGSESHKIQLEKIRKIGNMMAGKQECSLLTKNIRAYYHIHQKIGDKCPTVYISEIQVIAQASSDTGGLHEKKYSRGRVDVSKVDKVNLENRTIFVSGANSSPNNAMNDAEIYTNKKDPVLFFNPPSVAEDLGIGKSLRLLPSTRKLVQELKKTLLDNQNKNVAWYVQGEGAAVLSHAVQSISGSLEKHSFKFINAKAHLPSLLKTLSQSKAKLEGEFINYQSDKTALLAIVSQKQALLEQVTKLPITAGYETITRRYLMERISNLGIGNSVVLQQQNLRKSKITFIDALISTQGKK